MYDNNLSDYTNELIERCEQIIESRKGDLTDLIVLDSHDQCLINKMQLEKIEYLKYLIKKMGDGDE